MYNSCSLLSRFASCLSLATFVASFPTNSHEPTLSKRNATLEQSVFFDVNRTEVEGKIARLKSEGYRPTSLNIHGPPSDAKYAGIWTKQDGDAYEAILGANETAYNAWLDQWRADGYVSTHVSATGSASDALFAGVMQHIPAVRNWVQQCGLDSPWSYQNATMDTPMIIKGVSMYGAPGERQYCVLGHENTVNHQQTVSYQTDSYQDDYKVLEAAETSKRFWRPVYIDLTEDHVVTPIFDDTSVGRWAALTDLTISQLDSELVSRAADNMYPIHISGAGGAESRYAVIFAERITPLNREWHTTGAVTGFDDNAGVSAALDEVMQNFMKTSSVRQAQVAASVNGTVVASRAYTWAERDRAVVQPSDKFLLGSVSKAFTYAAVNHLISEGLLNLTTTVYPLLGYNDPADKRSLDITVQHLLDHTAGFDRTQSPDIGFIFTLVAQSLNQTTPATLRQLIEYIAARPLDYTPGESLVYSNYGTMLLSYVITNLTGESYTSYIEKNVLAGADVELWSTAAETHLSDSIVQETKYTGVSALTPLSENRVSSANGGDGSIKEEAIGAFGLKASAATISQFIGNNAVYGLGGRQSWSYRDGTVVGARAIAYSMDELDWALTLNTREYVNEAAWERLVFDDVRGVWDRFSLAE
ncbi:penicillin-binding protein PbpX [Stagonosporopsis vannaccii]|nr:penicillin-binding protein PbpX [Stagonosporopsis vannaccii]